MYYGTIKNFFKRIIIKDFFFLVLWQFTYIINRIFYLEEINQQHTILQTSGIQQMFLIIYSLPGTVLSARDKNIKEISRICTRVCICTEISVWSPIQTSSVRAGTVCVCICDCAHNTYACVIHRCTCVCVHNTYACVICRCTCVCVYLCVHYVCTLCVYIHVHV